MELLFKIRLEKSDLDKNDFKMFIKETLESILTNEFIEDNIKVEPINVPVKYKTIDDVLDLPLRTVLEKYATIHNLECGGYYGVCSDDLLTKLFNEYNIDEEYPEAFSVENLVSDEILVAYDEPLLDYPKLERIMENLGISKKSSGDGDGEV